MKHRHSSAGKTASSRDRGKRDWPPATYKSDDIVEIWFDNSTSQTSTSTCIPLKSRPFLRGYVFIASSDKGRGPCTPPFFQLFRFYLIWLP